MTYSAELQIEFPASDHSEATQKMTELTKLLIQAGYGHIATTILDDEGEPVAEFGMPS